MRTSLVGKASHVVGPLRWHLNAVFKMAQRDGAIEFNPASALFTSGSLRHGEIFAIRLGKVGKNCLVIDERIYGSNLDTPKGKKGKRTERTVAVSAGTMSGIQLWKAFLPDHGESSFLFPSEAGTPLRPNNLWRNKVRPRLEKVGLGWVNFQVLRRINASLSRKANVDDKVSADQRRHGLGVSLAVYAISDLDQKIEAVTKA